MAHKPTPWMTQNQVAELLQVTPRCVRLWIAAGKLTGYRLAGGRTMRIHRDEVESMLQPIPAASA